MNSEHLVICPVYNESGTLDVFFSCLREHYYGDVLFVNDGSTDGAGTILERFSGKDVFVINNRRRRGYGAALIKGFRFATVRKYRKVVTIDTDMQHDPALLPVFLKELSSNKVVLGSRYLMGEKEYSQVPADRLLINRYIADHIKRVYNVYFSDPFCGYRGYTLRFLLDADLAEQSYGFSLEVLMEMIRMRTVFSELEVKVRYPDMTRPFLDDLEDPVKRLNYYLKVISEKDRMIRCEKEDILSDKSASR